MAKKNDDFDLSDFLDEIDDSDEDISEEASDGVNVETAKREIEIRRAENRALKVKNKSQRVFMIKNGYINAGRTHTLYEPIDQSVLIEMIIVKSKKYIDMAERVKATLTKKVENVLLYYMPKKLKLCFEQYNQCFIPHPGFIYVTNVMNGAKKLSVTPNVPMYFEQYTERDVLNKHSRLIVYQLDELVVRYHTYAEKAIKLETKTAMFLSKVKNLMNLLELDVDYYDMYIKVIEERQAAEGQKRIEHLIK